jgi:hypothetical protein
MTKPESKKSKIIRKIAPKLKSSACTGVRPPFEATHKRTGVKCQHMGTLLDGREVYRGIGIGYKHMTWLVPHSLINRVMAA